MQKHWIITIVLVVIVGAGAFFGGMQYQKMQRPSFGQGGNFFAQRGSGSAGGARRFGNGQLGGNAVRGEIISSDANSITVKLQDGSSKIVLLGSSTSITESTNAGKDALQTGKQVMVFGNQNSDGSVTAQFIQLNPQQMQVRMTPQPTK